MIISYFLLISKNYFYNILSFYLVSKKIFINICSNFLYVTNLPEFFSDIFNLTNKLIFFFKKKKKKIIYY